jgi:hypothetical protein
MTAKAPTVFPDDGPLMKWLSAHGKAHVYDRGDRRKFDGAMGAFRKARDEQKPHGMLKFDLMFDDLLTAELVLSEGRMRFTTTITFRDAYVRETRNAAGNSLMSMGINAEPPEIMLEGLVGQPAEKAVMLPAILQPVVHGRQIISYSQFGQWATFELDPKPW